MVRGRIYIMYGPLGPRLHDSVCLLFRWRLPFTGATRLIYSTLDALTGMVPGLLTSF